ncbi:UNVERIFIED_ORG: hypothetical protein B2H98_06970 [Clostridium botulinum]
MEYISAKEFLKQPKEVQEVFLDWWKPSIGDLFSWIKKDDGYEHDLRKLECCNSDNIVEMTNSFKGTNEGDRIPLLSEGQLRKFIEDKYDCKMMVEYTICENIVIKLGKINKITGSFGFDRKFTCHKNKFDLLKAYWVVACEIAKGV